MASKQKACKNMWVQNGTLDPHLRVNFGLMCQSAMYMKQLLIL